MFNGKNSENTSASDSLTVIGPETTFQGVLSVKGMLRVEGVVEGDITDASAVEVGRGGKIKGNVSSETLSVAGEVIGDAVASTQIELLSTGRLTGSIKAPRIRIDEGALFDGQCSMKSEAASESTDTDDEAEPARADRYRYQQSAKRHRYHHPCRGHLVFSDADGSQRGEEEDRHQRVVHHRRQRAGG